MGVGGRVGKGLTAATATVSVKSCCLLAASAIIIPAAERHHEAISFRSPRASPKMSAFRTNRLPPFASQCPGRSKKMKNKNVLVDPPYPWSFYRVFVVSSCLGRSTVSLSFHHALVVPPCSDRSTIPLVVPPYPWSFHRALGRSTVPSSFHRALVVPPYPRRSTVL